MLVKVIDTEEGSFSARGMAPSLYLSVNYTHYPALLFLKIYPCSGVPFYGFVIKTEVLSEIYRSFIRRK